MAAAAHTSNHGRERPGPNARQSVARIRILDEEPDLGAGLSGEDLASARGALVAPVLEAIGPDWEPPAYDPQASFGLLILDGLIGRRVRVGRAVATELLSCGDILRPWDEAPTLGMSDVILDWRVFRVARMAVLDPAVTALIGRRPQLIVNFSARLLRRSRAAAYLMAVSHQNRVEDRLMETLWYLANSWGYVTPQGTRIPYRITHEVLSEVLGAQRPSVTTAFRSLTEQGLVRREPDGGFTVCRPAAGGAGASLAS